MRSEWREMILGDFVNFRRGHDLTRNNMVKGVIPVVGSNGIIGYHNKTILDENLITIGRSGNVGTPHIQTSGGWAHNTTLYIDDFKGSIPKFVYYFLYYLPLALFKGGSAVPTLNRNHIHTINISVPPLPTQKAIADTLSCLDAKIELNNKINQNLEAQAQAIFKSWFVDFEPFQDGEFVESELGLIPKGWRVGKLGDMIVVSSGKRPSERIENQTELYQYPVLGASGVMAYSKDILHNERLLVIGRVGTHGVVQEVDEPVWASDNTLVVRTRYWGYVYQYLKSVDYQSLNRGTTQPLITQKDIKNIDIAVPFSDILNKFETYYSIVFQKKKLIGLENTTLAALRDLLLPKLMSGQLTIPTETY